MITSIERFLRGTRNISSHPLMLESEKNIKLFEQFSVGLFDTTLIEIYSTNVFPESIKYKNGSKYLLWDSSYWNIFYNIIIMYFMAIHATDDDLCEWIKYQLEAQIYYFMALKTWDETELSLEFSRSYRELIQRQIQVETTEENLETYSKYVYEVGFIAKVFCLFHELNHMDNFEENADFLNKQNVLTELFKITATFIEKDTSFLTQLREHYSEGKIHDALSQIIERKNPDLEIELTCDLAALNDTVDFFEEVWPDLSKETIFSRINEVVIVFNSINFSLTQTYRYWQNKYKYFLGKINSEKYLKRIEIANQESVLRFVLSDVTKAIQSYNLYGDKIDDLLNTDYYGLRFQVENAFIEEVANNINCQEHFEKIYENIKRYKNVSEEKMETFRKILLEW